MRRPRWTFRLVAFAFVSVALTGTILPLSRAGADPLADKPPRPTIAVAATGAGRFTTSAPPAGASRASRAVAEARRMLGKRYQWAGAGPNAFDCSGLTKWAWQAAGVRLAHYSRAQYGATTHVRIDQLQPGDLVFFHRSISHVGIYVGGGRMIHAPQTGDVVRYASIFSDGYPIYAGRVTG